MSETKEDVEGVLATIIESGSTNTIGYIVAINDHGSATAQIDCRFDLPPRSQQFPPGTFDTTCLHSLLRRIGGVSEIPIETIEISDAGKTSGNLRSIEQQPSRYDQARLQAAKDLAKLLQATLSQLKIG